ncbi:MAG TPA: hypothetical protein VNL15_03130, partial [Dehalococcoidia bacterium]|nr:hypothetical protein [Dehalococcoidia bacterium]
MSDERKRRGRKRGQRGRQEPAGPPSAGRESQTQGQTGGQTSSALPLGSSTPSGQPRSSRREQRTQPGRPVSPLTFWRRSSPKPARAQARTSQGGRGQGGRFSNFYLPPWAPVAGVMGIVGVIFLAVILVRQSSGDPKVGDHWHARYTVTICGEQQPNIPTFEDPAGIHTHGDGLVHMHPFNTSGEGGGARLIRFFEYAGGELSNDSLRMPTEDQ